MQAERAWLRWVRRQAEAAGGRRELRLGIGDDAALLRPRRGWELALTTDLLIEDVHFLRASDPARSCGERLAARALSDLAAMGAEPVALFVSSAYPADLPTTWARQLYRGLLQAARAAGACLAGGDVAASPTKIFLDVVGVGQVPAGSGLQRSGAGGGDRIFVSGRLGEAALGRELAHGGDTRGISSQRVSSRRALARHRHPRARWELGLALRGIASAAVDLSDGLSTDLDHLCEASGVGADIAADQVPRLSDALGLRRALHGGEDYELLFTVPPRRLAKLAALRARFDLHEIGCITAGPQMWLCHPDRRRERLRPAGWQHFG